MPLDEARKKIGSTIRILDRNTINQIAAGEVIERPASVVKELVENSIDGGADKIIVRVEEGGIKRIEVEDNGIGMTKEDAILAFEKHATSKIRSIEDLQHISTLGFRGEALPSIASVAKVEMTTRRKESPEESGVLIRIEGGEKREIKSFARSPGTKVVVKDLFYNTPARRNYLKTPRTELNHIIDVMTRYALYHGNINMQLFHHGTRIMNSPKSSSLLMNIASIYGKNTAKEFIEVEYARDFFSLKGYISKPSVNRASRSHQYIYVNGRYVKSEVIYKAIKTAYGNLLPKERYPIVVLKIQIAPGKVDVNVHPTKEEVRFSDDYMIMEGVVNAIRYQLYKHKLLGDGSELGKPLYPEKVEITQEAGGEGKRFLEIKEPFKRYKAESFGTTVEREKSWRRISQRKSSQRQLRIDYPKEEERKGLLERVRHLRIEPKYVDESKVPEMTPIGQIFELYILAVGVDSLYIIDQHAVHEKIIYERLKKGLEEKERGARQKLIEPVHFECTQKEEEIIKEHLFFLAKLGFEIVYFGKNTFLVKSVPSVLGRAVEKETIFDIIEEMLDIYKRKKVVDSQDEVIKTVACHSAIRKGKELTLQEMEELIREIQSAENIYSCPHGRPTIISISVEELEKRFKRR